MASALKFIGGGLLEGFGRGLAEQGKATGKAKRERALMEGKAKFERILADLEHKRALELEDVKQGNRKELKTEDRDAQQTNALALKLAPVLPSNYQRTEEGGVELMPGYLEGQRDLAAAKRDPDGGVTLAQRSNNAEIDQARATLDRMGLDKAEILRRIQKATNTGRENPDYDPGLERLVRTATQRKVGSDPYFNLFHRRYLGPPPEFSESAGPRQLPPGVSAEQPGILDRIGDFFSGGDDKPRPASDDGRPRGRPRGRGRIRGRGGSTKKPIRQMSKAEIANLLDERGEDLTEDERKAIQARLDALGL